ncbi:hypothetical protein E2C01_026551 [Portunus trituberculatus]|uniref:Uncharacterized protein n=1 Tax=Portunus trituberculatus TaxID=210409 RepID=A0A5B7EIW3_PORTR|nr:hypothetical protein [Portunus trituberculatus]
MNMKTHPGTEGVTGVVGVPQWGVGCICLMSWRAFDVVDAGTKTNKHLMELYAFISCLMNDLYFSFYFFIVCVCVCVCVFLGCVFVNLLKELMGCVDVCHFALSGVG